jgi:uncharacterized protein
MTDSETVKRTIIFVQETLKDAEGGHDWFHTERVLKNARRIAKGESVDELVISLGALLHDIADAKFNDGDESFGPKIAKKFLSSLKLNEKVIDQVINIIAHISFKNSLPTDNQSYYNSKELQIIQDADRLDAIGAIGIARAFNYGGFKNRELYNPDISPNLSLTKEEYKKSTTPTINHFYEKLLLLKNKMNTRTGKKLAEERHNYMRNYLEQFYREWNGDS